MNRLTNDDLFEGSTMSFGEHLEELRVCLFKSVMGLAVGVAIGFYLANSVVNFFQRPLKNTLEKYYIELAEQRLRNEQGGELTPEQRRTLRESRLIREVLRLDMDRLVDVIGQAYPQAVAAGVVQRHAFLPQDLRPGHEAELAGDLLKRFGAREKGEAAPLLSDEQTEALQRLKATTDKLSDADQRQLIMILDSLLDHPEVAQDKSLTATDPETAEVLRKSLAETPDPEKTRRLNKLLLAGSFPHALRPPQLNLVELSFWRPALVKFQVLTAEEAFMIWMKAGIVSGIVIASPWILYQIWIFVAAGLYPHEKNYVYIFLPASMLLFFAGASLAYWFVFEPVLNFLFQFQKEMDATFEPRIGEWLSFVLILPIGFGISFQLPLVMLFINRLGIIDVSTYTANWRVAILAIFLIAMVLTPADPISMLLMAVPLCFLYVLGILLCMWMPRSRSPFGEVYEP